MASILDARVDVGHVHLKVADLDRAIGFYRDVLGFDLVQRLGDQAGFLSAGGYHHHVGVNTWESRGGWPPPTGTTGLYHAAIRFPDRATLGGAVRALLEHGIELDGATDHGYSEAVYLRDPDGNGLELSRDRSRADWPLEADGALGTSRSRLDLDALLAEAAPDTNGSAGLDRRVCIGHVHLKVADLDRALAFYRDVLGFDLRKRYADDAAFLSAGGYHHHVALNTWESRGGTPPPPGTTGLFHAAFRFPDRRSLAQVLLRLVDAGIQLDGASDHGVSEALYLRDPDDNGVELYRDRQREEWPLLADGTIAMFTAPLDLRSLLAEA
jgi:catechol 2,3-dioxygenase